jgi:hypothetical protein
MKKLFLLSTMITTSFFTCELKAELLNIPENSTHCSEFTPNTPEHERCKGLNDCMAYSTDTKREYNDCKLVVEAAYVESKQGSSADLMPASMVTNEVGTELAGSNVNTPQREKGWKFSQEGD